MSRKPVLLALVLLALASPATAQDAGTVSDLAQLLSLEDRREFDGPLLRRASQHPDSLVRQRAALAMGRIGDRSAGPLLVPLLTDRDSAVRLEAAFAIGRLGDRTLVPELANLASRFASEAAGEFEIEVVTAMARLGGAEAERALGAILDRHPANMAPAVDRATAQVLLEAWRLGERSSLAPRLKDYARGSRGDWRRNATYSATRMRLVDAAPALVEIAPDPDPLTRSYVARGLLARVADSARLPREAFVVPLRALINDDVAQVRINALRALATFEDSSLVPLAAARLVDRDNNVPVQAAATLGALGGSRAAATLAERFPGAATFGLRRAILVSLAQIAPAQAIEVGRAWRTDTDWRLRATYVEMLSVAATPAARQQLLELINDDEPRVVAAVLNALGTIAERGDTSLIALARERLNAADVGVRAAAIDLLGRERNPAAAREIADAYRRAESDPLNDARLSAVRALATIAEGSPAARTDVEALLLSGNPRSNDYLVRRLVAQRLGEPAMRRTWGPVGPIETGRSPEEYRDLARRYVLGQGRPGTVTIETERGNLVLSLYAEAAPLTVDNFLRLIGRRFFDNGRWHRVVPNFVIQDGDPRGDGSGGPGTVIRDEINRRRYERATVGMALSGPDTGGSQFFITHAPQPHLDGGYTVFGQVVSGFDVLDQIVQGDRIRRIFR